MNKNVKQSDKSLFFHLLIGIAGFLFAFLIFSNIHLFSTIFQYKFSFVAYGSFLAGLSSLGIAFLPAKGRRPASRNPEKPYDLLDSRFRGNDKTGINRSFLNSILDNHAIALSGIFMALNICLSVVAPFGSFWSFLLLFAIALLSFAFFTYGTISLWQTKSATAGPAAAGVLFAGMLAGIAVFSALGRLDGFLPAAALTAAILFVFPLFLQRNWPALVASMLGFSLLGLAGIFAHGDLAASPRWTAAENILPKSRFLETAQEEMDRVTTLWTLFARTDVWQPKGTGEDFLRISVNGLDRGLIPAERFGENNLREQFPLIALPLQAGEPRRILVIGAGDGLLLRMALDSGVSRIRIMGNGFATQAILDRTGAYHGNLQSKAGVAFAQGDARNILYHDRDRYDQIFVLIPENSVPGWTGQDPADEYLYTKEAFRDYWERLETGGALVVLAGEEKLFTRALLTSWEILRENPSGGSDRLVRQSWGYQDIAMSSRTRPYQFLHLLIKGQQPQRLSSRITTAAKSMRIINLYGPDTVPPPSFNILHQPYAILFHPEGLDMARTALTQAMNWHLKTPTSLASATHEQPFFFDIANEIHPFLKWLLAICVAVLIYVFLVPLAGERHPDHPMSGKRPPLPITFGFFAAVTAGFVMATIAATHQAALTSGSSGPALSAVLAGIVVGMAGVLATRRPSPDRSRLFWPGTILVMPVLFGLEQWFFTDSLTILGEWNVGWRVTAIALVAAPTGYATFFLLAAGIGFLGRYSRPVAFWTWLAAAAAAPPAAAVIALWSAQLWGWKTVWWTAAGCYAGAAIAGLWHAWLQGRHRETTTSAAT